MYVPSIEEKKLVIHCSFGVIPESLIKSRRQGWFLGRYTYDAESAAVSLSVFKFRARICIISDTASTEGGWVGVDASSASADGGRGGVRGGQSKTDASGVQGL